MITKTEVKITNNHAELKESDAAINARIEAIEQTVNSTKKMLTLLDERIKSMGKAAAMSGNPGMAGNLLQDLEDAIAKLRLDLDNNKANCAKNHANVQ
jgi:chromosome segregation ATPase